MESYASQAPTPWKKRVGIEARGVLACGRSVGILAPAATTMIAPPADFTAVLLAGGESRRMGRDKAGVLFEGEPLWRRQLATLRATAPAEVLISGRADGPYAHASLEIVEDDTPGRGPLAGVVAAMRRLRCERLLVLAIDLPAMQAEFLASLLARAASDGGGVVPVDGTRVEPLAAVYPRAALPLAERCLAGSDHSMQHFVRLAHRQGLVVFRPITDAERPLFRNVNSPSDL